MGDVPEGMIDLPDHDARLAAIGFERGFTQIPSKSVEYRRLIADDHTPQTLQLLDPVREAACLSGSEKSVVVFQERCDLLSSHTVLWLNLTETPFI
jgi:hypothetical protein